MSVSVSVFGKTKDRQDIHEYAISNDSGMTAVITDMGACITRLIVPDKDRTPVDVVLGFEHGESYIDNAGCLGATVGRHANRIAGASYTLNGVSYRLAANDGPNNLHSNPGSYYLRLWSCDILGDNAVAMSLSSPDGDQGYPGNFRVTVTFTVTSDNVLRIAYSMTCDQDTLANMTNHSYFNLNGHDSGTVLDQVVTINADYFTPSDTALIPTGEIRSVRQTPFDFTAKKAIGRDIGQPDEQLINGGGYDHNFVRRDAEGFGYAATMESLKNRIAMDVYTDMPGMQFYTANTTDLTDGKGGCQYGTYSGACFETQFFPDAIHHENFPSCVLKANTVSRSVTEYRFYVNRQ